MAVALEKEGGPPVTTTVRRRRENQDGLVPWLFSAPAIVLLLVFMVIPFLLALVFSFTNLRLVSPLPLKFVGVDNYLRVLQDPLFYTALWHNFLFALVVVPIQTALALWLAILINQKLKGVKLYRTIYFMPVVTVMAVAATIWRLMFEPDSGLINGILGFLSAGALQPGWLRDPNTALLAIIIISIWQGVGFQMVILLAGLQDISEELYEAASIDGANKWQQFLYVTIPQLRNQLIFVTTITTILAFRLFDQVWVTTRGGPLDSTQTLMLQLVDVGFSQQKIAQGSAIAVIFFLIVLALSLIQRRFIKEEGEV